MRVPFNDLKRQYVNLSNMLEAALSRVASSGWYVMGPEHDRFEQAFSDYLQCAHVIAVGNGTDALELALRCANCGPGDEVVTAANAGGYATTAIRLLGATPVFADIDPLTLTISPSSLASVISERARAVVATHLSGKMADMTALRAVTGNSVVLIEDCAQAHGALYNGHQAGTLGDLATFSFYPTKNLGALGDGGAVATNSEAYTVQLRQLRQYGWEGRYKTIVPGGRNSRLDEMQAAILTAKLPYLDEWNQRRRDIVARYRVAAEGTPLRIVHTPAPDYVGHLCVALHDARDTFRKRLAENDVDTAIHYPYLDTQQPVCATTGNWRAASLEVASDVVNTILSLPCFPELRDEEVDQVCQAIRTCA